MESTKIVEYFPPTTGTPAGAGTPAGSGVPVGNNEHPLHHYFSLSPQEQDLVSQSVDRRKADFGDARWCAHEAMKFFIPDQPILRGERGMPLFPSPVVGSLTHTEGYRAAIVGSSNRWKSLGIDAEPACRLPAGVLQSVASQREQEQLSQQEREWGIDILDTVLFSAKETTYKAWFPLTHRFLDFHEAELRLYEDGHFVSRILQQSRHAQAIQHIEGQWRIDRGYVVTVAGVSA